MHGGSMGPPPVLVVGSGVAGLCTALAAAPRPVLLVGRGRQAEDSASVRAQGGIAAALAPGDSVAAHVDDTLTAGAWHNDTSRVQLLAGAAADAVAWLEAQGVAFDRNGPALRLAREGGHRCARVVHAGGDASGARMVAALVEAARRAPHIRWRGGVDVHGLGLRGGRVAAACLRTPGDGGTGPVDEWIEVADVVLATGGIGALFARTTNPEGADGAGLALAMAAGAAVADLEFVQFHPTALDVPGHSLPLVTEALRGAGARLLDASGRPLMAGRHPQGDLAPRDVVARAVWEAGRQGGVRLDARGPGIDWEHAFPTVLAHCLDHGIDPRMVPIPVAPAVHFHMGGVVTDALGRSSVPGLHAVGEVACTGVHGANRLASNSLLEGVVFGRRLGAHLAQSGRPTADGGTLRRVLRGPGLDSPALVRLRDLLSDAAGPVRTAEDLYAALAEARALAPSGWQARLAAAILEAASERRASLGAHWLDEPQARAQA